MSKERHRSNVAFSMRQVDQLNKLKKNLDAGSWREVITRALNVLDWADENQRARRRLASVDANDEESIEYFILV